MGGQAKLTLAGDELTVKITATGLEQARIHPQYIKGFRTQKCTRCPTEADDRNRDGFVEKREGRSAFGRTLLRLEPFPTVKRGQDELVYELTFDLSEGERRRLEPLENHAVVLAGKEANLERDRRARSVRTLPVACGVIRAPEQR